MKTIEDTEMQFLATLPDSAPIALIAVLDADGYLHVSARGSKSLIPRFAEEVWRQVSEREPDASFDKEEVVTAFGGGSQTIN